MLTPSEKSHLLDAVEEGQTCDAASRRTMSPTQYRLSYSSPDQHLNLSKMLSECGVAL